MKVALISTYFDIEANGLRMLSSVLRRAGHRTKQIFLPKTGDGHTSEYPAEAVGDILELCGDVDLVGLTLMSNNFLTASHLTDAIKRKHGAPVVWGGIHPTVRPEESIQHADYVCVGEGEEAAVELASALARGEDATAIANVWARRGDEIVRNPHRPLIEDLDSLPYADYSLEDHYVLEHGRVVRMGHEHLERFLLYRYITSTSRGCILNCSFCCHNAFRKMYGAKAGNTRRRSVEHVIGELEQIKRRMPYVRRIVIDDDSFMDASIEYIHDFARQYRSRVGLPFMVTGFIPITVTEEKTASLVDAGLYNVRMGIQSGAQNTKRIYRRNIKDSVIVRAATIFDKWRSAIRLPNYDLILDNPWENDEDRADTLRLLQELPRPFIITFYSLTFYPGTDLYERARQEGRIQDDVRDIYQKDYLKVNRTYMNGLTYLFGAYRIPKPIERVLLSPAIVNRKPDFLFYPLWFLGWPAYLLVRAFRFLLGGDFTRVMRWARLGIRDFRIRAEAANQA